MAESQCNSRTTQELVTAMHTAADQMFDKLQDLNSGRLNQSEKKVIYEFLDKQSGELQGAMDLLQVMGCSW